MKYLLNLYTYRCLLIITIVLFTFIKLPSTAHAYPITTTWDVWTVTIQNISPSALDVWTWVDCYSTYQPNCPPQYNGTSGQSVRILQPGQTITLGPGPSFCFEGQIDIGSIPGGSDYGGQRFYRDSGTIQSNGINGVCGIPTPVPPLPSPTPGGIGFGSSGYDINCGNMSGPTTLQVGQRGTFTSDFTSFTGAWTYGINLLNQSGSGYTELLVGAGDTGPVQVRSGTYSVNWTPTSPGTYIIFCDVGYTLTSPIVSCFGYPDPLYVRPLPLPGGAGVFQCEAPRGYITVNVAPPIPDYDISGRVFIDMNENGIQDSGENGYTGATLTLSGSASDTETTNSSGAYSFANYNSGSYTIRLTVPSGYSTTTANPRTVTLTNANISNVAFGIMPLYTISGTVFVDINENGVKEVSEASLSNVPVSLTGRSSDAANTNSSGIYSLSDLSQGSYSVRITVPSGYVAVSSNLRSVLLGPSTIINFGVVPIYSVTGTVFVDENKNRLKEGAESNYTGGITIQANTGTVSISNGTYTVSNLRSGTHTISYTSTIPNGFQLIYPRNGPPPSFSVTVGPTCTTDATTGASCTARGDIINLHFSISDFIPWVQMVGLSARFDDGYTNFIPPAPTCTGAEAIVGSTSGTPGILMVGDASPNFGRGSASSTDWIVGGTAYPEVYRPAVGTLATSYTSLLTTTQKSGTPITNIQTICNTNSCSLPNNLNASVLRANGNLTLNSYSFPNNRNYIILVNGTLRIRGGLDVPVGSTAVFSAANDIIIDSSVGDTPSCGRLNEHVDGYFSADRHFIIDGVNNCAVGPDSMLRVEGSIFVNAAYRGGVFQNNRDLCGANKQYPVVQFVSRPDFILHTTNILKRHSLTYREVAP